MTGSEPFRCMRCGTCCRWSGHVFLTKADTEALARELGLEEAAFLELHVRLAPNRAELVLAEREDGACVFLEGTACVVYDSRPAQCRGYPATWRAREPCPGLLPEEPTRPTSPLPRP